jgi:hypothetical protein
MAVAGVTAIDVTVAEVTVKVEAGEVLPPKAAVMADVPEVTPAARPVCNPTVATAGVSEAQLADVVTSTGGPELIVAIAVNCWMPLAGIVAVAGITVMDTMSFGNQCPVPPPPPHPVMKKTLRMKISKR